MTRFALTLEYDGSGYLGLQRQPDGPTIQNSIEEAAAAITGEQVVMHAAGRTDAGVHALAMRAHIDIDKDISAFRLQEGMNSKLRPQPIAVLDCVKVTDDWHARFSCTGRRYIYRIVNRRTPLTLDAGRCWKVGQPLDVDEMHDAAQILVGQHDFTTFRSAHCQAKSPVKSIDTITVRRDGDIIEARVAARSFLQHQVRSIMGCLVLVGNGKWTRSDLRHALEARDRHELGFNAPPDGLYFAGAEYPAET